MEPGYRSQALGLDLSPNTPLSVLEVIAKMGAWSLIKFKEFIT